MDEKTTNDVIDDLIEHLEITEIMINQRSWDPVPCFCGFPPGSMYARFSQDSHVQSLKDAIVEYEL